MSARHRDALAHLLYGVGAGGGFILLTGEVGTGKTTLNRCLLEQLPHDTDIAIILNPALNAMELLATACDELGISYDTDNHTLKTLTDKLHSYLLENHARGRKTVLLIDEAQHLDFEVLEQIRLLTNLETHSEKLLQIILIGQPELSQMLAQPQLRQLNQRITARYNLEPLNQEETGAYIHHRLQVAGMPADRVIFPPRVVRGIYRRTRGIPRLINVLCDRILLGAYGRNKSRADMSMLRLAAREVMGEDGDKIEPASWLRPVLLAAVLLAMCAWWALEYVLVQDEVASLEPVAITDTPITPQPARPRESPEPEPSAPVEIVETPPAAESLAPAVQPQPEPEPQADPEQSNPSLSLSRRQTPSGCSPPRRGNPASGPSTRACRSPGISVRSRRWRNWPAWMTLPTPGMTCWGLTGRCCWTWSPRSASRRPSSCWGWKGERPGWRPGAVWQL
jgi:general secretion pathway protein A